MVLFAFCNTYRLLSPFRNYMYVHNLVLAHGNFILNRSSIAPWTRRN